MVPIRLTLHNFLSYHDAMLDFATFDLAVLTGPNGVGKSSLLEAISWGVWEQARAASSDELIRQGENNMWVELVFEHEGGVYRIVRRRVKKTRGGETTLEFQVKQSSEVAKGIERWESLTEGTIRQTQEKIIKMLRISYEIFTNSSYLRQGHADEFTIKTPSQRKAILADILGLSDYDKLEERAREKRRQAENRLQLLVIQTEELKATINQKHELQEQLATAKGSYDDLMKTVVLVQKNLEKMSEDRQRFDKINHQLELERKHFATLQIQLKDVITTRDELQHEIKTFEAQGGTPDIEAQLKKELAQYEKVKRELDGITHKQLIAQELERELAVGESKKNDLSGVVKRLSELRSCPTCLRPLPKAEAQKIIKNLEAEFEKTAGAAIGKLRGALAKLGFSKGQLERLRGEYRKLEQVVMRSQELKVTAAKIEEKKQYIEKLEAQRKNLNKELDAIMDSGKKLKLEAREFEHAATRYEEEKKHLEELLVRKGEGERLLGGLTEQLKMRQQEQEKAKKIGEETVKLQSEASGWQALALAFSKRGIQAMIIEQTLPAIEQEANLILSRLSEGRLKIAFATQRAKRTGEDVIETLDIIVADELGSRAYELYSGGEGFRINFAIRVAISKLLSMRAGSKLKFLVVDEGFGMLDQAGQQDIIAAINAIREDFAKVIVVTHIDEIKDAFQTRIEVVKTAAGSQINVQT